MLQLLLDVWHRRTDGNKDKMARFLYERNFDTWGPVTINLSDEYSSINLTTSVRTNHDL